MADTGAESWLNGPLMEWQWPIAGAIVYPIVMELMKFVLGKKERDVHVLVGIHNLILSIGSLIMFVGAGLELKKFIDEGLWTMEDFFCLPKGEPRLPEGLRLYSYLFYISKYWELLDTVLLVLKGRPTTFLHVYHHSNVIIYSWIWALSEHPWVIGGVMLNTMVHTFMYYYFFRTAFGAKLWWRKYITVLQIAQFAMGGPCALLYMYYHLQTGCTEIGTFCFTGFFDVTLLILFSKFFQKSYSKPKKQE